VIASTLNPVQATVHRFDAESGGGELITDQGLLLPLEPAVFAASGLRLLRAGQRLSVELDDDRVVAVRLGTIR
jgi:2-phospho-L-lactate guanylyltransferase